MPPSTSTRAPGYSASGGPTARQPSATLSLMLATAAGSRPAGRRTSMWRGVGHAHQVGQRAAPAAAEGLEAVHGHGRHGLAAPGAAGAAAGAGAARRSGRARSRGRRGRSRSPPSPPPRPRPRTRGRSGRAPGTGSARAAARRRDRRRPPPAAGRRASSAVSSAGSGASCHSSRPASRKTSVRTLALGEGRRRKGERGGGEFLGPDQLLLAVDPLHSASGTIPIPSGRNFTGPITVVMSVAAIASRIFSRSSAARALRAAARICTQA